MPEIFIENLTAKPVWVRLNSGDQLNVYPRTHSAPVPNSEIENNERVKKLVDLAAIRLHRGFVEEKKKEVTVQAPLSNPPLQGVEQSLQSSQLTSTSHNQIKSPNKRGSTSPKNKKETKGKAQAPTKALSDLHEKQGVSIESKELLQEQKSSNPTANDGETQ